MHHTFWQRIYISKRSEEFGNENGINIDNWVKGKIDNKNSVNKDSEVEERNR